MSAAREDVLGRIRAAVAKGRPANAAASVEARLAAHRANLIPARAQRPAEARMALFQAMAEEASATVARVTAIAQDSMIGCWGGSGGTTPGGGEPCLRV